MAAETLLLLRFGLLGDLLPEDPLLGDASGALLGALSCLCFSLRLLPGLLGRSEQTLALFAQPFKLLDQGRSGRFRTSWRLKGT